jgi:hypothetical protein
MGRVIREKWYDKRFAAYRIRKIMDVVSDKCCPGTAGTLNKVQLSLQLMLSVSCQRDKKNIAHVSSLAFPLFSL